MKITLTLFADDSKIISVLKGQFGIETLQEDSDIVGDWCRTWCVMLIVEKRKVMHLKKSNHQVLYCMKDESWNEGYIEETKIERDLGVVISNDLKWREHVDRMAGNANRTISMLKRTFESRNFELWKELYVSLVRSHLEYDAQVRNPHLKGNMDKIEKV